MALSTPPSTPSSTQAVWEQYQKSIQISAWRLILDLSHPAGHSINDGIEKPACSLTYIIVDEVVQKVLLPGRGCQLAKIDIESAFRNVPVHPQDRHLLALSWNGNIFIEALALDLHQRSLMPWQMLSNGSRSEVAFPTSDILWWHIFSDDWNGLSMMQHSRCQHPDIFLTSDASGSWDCGAYYGTHWLQYPWSPLTKEYNITATELLPIIVLGAAVWGGKWENKSLLCRRDNEAVVHIINTGTSRDPIAMGLMCCLYFIAAKFKLIVSATHLAGKANTLADALSRNNASHFLSTFSQPGLLFHFSDGSLLTKSKFVDKFRTLLQQAGIDGSLYSGHSFHIGAAATAAANRVEDSLIQTLGRRKSPAYLTYVHIPAENLAASYICIDMS